jgi:hypothetical protein
MNDKQPHDIALSPITRAILSPTRDSKLTLRSARLIVEVVAYERLLLYEKWLCLRDNALISIATSQSASQS